MSSSGCDLLLGLLTQLRLPEESVALALLYLHKYNRWQKSSLKESLDTETLTLSIVSLAAKASEKPRRLREILVPAYNQINSKGARLTFPSELYDKLRASLVNAELLLLRILKFELRFSTPIEYLDDILRDYVEYSRTDKSHLEDYVLVTDSLLGLVCRSTILGALRNESLATSYTAKTIAVSCVIMSARTLGMRIPHDSSTKNLHSWITDVGREDVVDIEDCLEELAR